MGRSDARRSEILDAALASYAELGWASTTIADVRSRSGASTGSIYHHFGTKEGIAASLYAELLRGYHDSLLERVGRARSARGLVRGIVLHHLDWAADNPDRARFLMEMRSTEAVRSHEAELREATKRLLRAIRDRIERHVEAGAIVRMPRSLYAPILIGPAHDVVRHWLRGRMHLDLADARGPLADAAWRALCATE